MLSELEKKLGHALLQHPFQYGCRYTEEASRDLLELLFRSMTGFDDEYLRMLFPDGLPEGEWNLFEAQGAEEGAEYTEAARGKRCGHILKNGEASYHCRTCTTDDTCCLCTKCFEASDHKDHNYVISLSTGQNGCCDCGDDEAFRVPLLCAIHTATDRPTDKGKETAQVPAAFVDSIKTTIGRVFDYFCDVISCAPEQLRLPKTEEGVRQDEASSRLSADWYGGSDQIEEQPEFAVVLWNDEKHTVNEVKHQVARACKERMRFGEQKANETHEIGRSVVKYSKDLPRLLEVANVIEQIKVTVSVRSARDTYREQMCGTMLEWLSDIAGCHVCQDGDLLRNTICEQMLQPWRLGSNASNAYIGGKGIYDHAEEDKQYEDGRFGFTRNRLAQLIVDLGTGGNAVVTATDVADGDGGDGEDPEDEENIEEEDEEMEEADLVQANLERMANVFEDAAIPGRELDMEMNTDDDLEVDEATIAGYPRPPPPPLPRAQAQAPQPSDDTPTLAVPSGVHDDETTSTAQPRQVQIPRTPGARHKFHPRAPHYWGVKPRGYHRFAERQDIPIYEDLSQRTRLDAMILFDLRLWKKTRADIRELCLGTVVKVPDFKRILGLRFSALYPTLAQLYLIADREPDHSIINLSVQLLTTTSITEEVVERGNFLTNIMAILYTFLTTRQVGEPRDIDSSATLASDTQSVSNRRLYHFLHDLRWLLPSEPVKTRIRNEPQYLLQFLDLVKLSQGICPNVRAIGDHVEFETDHWIGASILMKEFNKHCRLFCDAFRTYQYNEDDTHLPEAITTAAISTMMNSVGMERKRFDLCEIKDIVKFKSVPYVEFEIESNGTYGRHRIVDFVVERGAISFHHALHYTLSWLLECGRSMPRESMKDILVHAAELARTECFVNTAAQPLDADDIILAVFDFPLRVCAWLAQMKAGMWVRNGLSLRHQMNTYRAVLSRDTAYYRDLFLLQTALVICDPSRFLATMTDRFGMVDWIRGVYKARPGYDEPQHVDVVEDFVHLLIILITDRTSLVPMDEDDEVFQNSIISKDIAHALCFRPLSFTELSARVPDKVADSDNFHDVLDEIAVFRAPEGMNDSGTFELKPEYLELVDPYCAQYSKNQRDEAENLYKRWMAKKTGKHASDVVFEPMLRQIPSGTFSKLSEFTKTPLFAQIIHHCLDYCLTSKTCTPTISASRVETFLHVVLHLTLLAVIEDDTDEEDLGEPHIQSFVLHSLFKTRPTQLGQCTIVGLLQKISKVAEFESCGPRIRHILKKFWQKRPKSYATATATLEFPFDKVEAPSPAANQESDAELKKKQALDRQAKVMAQFQQQQQRFLDAQGSIDWGEEDFSDEEEPSVIGPTETKLWKYPSGTCILCQEDTNDSRLYGTFAMITDSAILRQTDLHDADFVREALKTPSSLDRSADDIRPFGVAGENREIIRKLDAKGGEAVIEKQGLGKGFPPSQTMRGTVTTGCGHIMHYNCFEEYFASTQRRHIHQVARNHPERLLFREFVCPLCKALGNAFLPIIWKGKEESYPGALTTRESFEEYTGEYLVHTVSRFRNHALIMDSDKMYSSGYQDLFVDYISKNFIPPLSNKMEKLASPSITESVSQNPRLAMPGLFPAPEEPSGSIALHQGVGSALSDSPFTELVTIYKRLCETLKSNHIKSRFSDQSMSTTQDDLVLSDALIRSFGFSISSVEIAQRGVGSEPGATLLDTIPQISLTNLRVLAETAFSYASVGGLFNSPSNRTSGEFRDMHRRKLCQLFLGHPDLSGLANLVRENNNIEPLLGLDVFVFLAECSLCLVPVINIDIAHLVRICYAAEILKSVLAYIIRPQGLMAELERNDAQFFAEKDYMSSELDPMRRLFYWVVETYKSSAVQQPAARNQFLEAKIVPEHVLRSLRNLTATYALPFLRKTVVMLHVQYGVEFPNTGPEHSNLPELDRLTTLLRLPSIDDIFESIATGDDSNILQTLAVGWIAHWNIFRLGIDVEDSGLLTPSLSHPAIFELVGLPKYFDFLLDEATRRRCKTTGKDMTDPCICLFCGDIFCSQAVCCSGGGKLGGCNRHAEQCGNRVGLFINIRKCMVLLLHNRNGSWQLAPYLDIHGEVDPGFRHRRRLILNQKRYDRLLRDVWLSHGIPAAISRKLESEINTGGWETL